MAITKLLRIAENRSQEKKNVNPSAGLHRNLKYILDPEKTGVLTYVTGNCGADADFIYREMFANKKRWGKTHGTQGFHYVISFHPEDEITPQLALKVIEDFSQELLGGAHIWVAAVHTNTEHLHVHLTFDSVSFRTGQKFHSSRYDWLARIQPLTDKVCQRYGLHTLSFDREAERTYAYHAEWEDQKLHGQVKKQTCWSDIIRDDIDECIKEASDWDDFLGRLQQKAYIVRDRKYLSLQPYGRKNALRSVRLGPGYSREALQARLGQPTADFRAPDRKGYILYGDAREIYHAALPYILTEKPYAPLQKRFFQRQMRLRHIRSPLFRNSGYRYQKDVARLGEITDMTAYLFRHDITSSAEAAERLQQLERSRGREAARERKILRNILEEIPRMQQPEDIGSLSFPNFPLPSAQDVYQIRINETLFADVDLSKETFTVRIPGSQEYVRLYSDDSRSYNEGKTLSSYLYTGAEYQIETEDGTVLRKMTGNGLKDCFKSRRLETATKKEEKTWETTPQRR